MIQNNNLLQLDHLFDANQKSIIEINNCKEKVDLTSQKKDIVHWTKIFHKF